MSPNTTFCQEDNETFLEVFEGAVRLVSVNGIVLDYEGKPVRNVRNNPC